MVGCLAVCWKAIEFFYFGNAIGVRPITLLIHGSFSKDVLVGKHPRHLGLLRGHGRLEQCYLLYLLEYLGCQCSGKKTICKHRQVPMFELKFTNLEISTGTPEANI